jgi:hypothetical protein
MFGLPPEIHKSMEMMKKKILTPRCRPRLPLSHARRRLGPIHRCWPRAAAAAYARPPSRPPPGPCTAAAARRHLAAPGPRPAGPRRYREEDKDLCYPSRQQPESSSIFPVYEGESASTKGNNVLGKFTIYGLPPGPKGTIKFDVTFDRH